MTDKSLSLLDKIVNHTGKSARTLEVLEDYFKKQNNLTSSNSTMIQGMSNSSSVGKLEKGSSTQLIDSSKAITEMTKSLVKYAMVPKSVKNSFLTFLSKYVDIIDNKKQSNVGATFISDSLDSLGLSLSYLSKNIIAFSKIKKKDENKFFDFIDRLIVSLEKNKNKINALEKNKTLDKLLNISRTLDTFSKKFKPENIDKSQKILRKTATAIIGFSTAILTGGIILTAAVTVLIPSIAVLYGVAKVFSYIGRESRFIERGGKALKTVGWSMILLAGGLSILGLAVVLNPLGIIGGIMAIRLTGLVYTLIGKGWPSIRKGSLAVLAMSISTAIFGLSTLVWSNAKIDILGTVLPIAGSLLILGDAYSFLGLAIKRIVPGAIAAGLIGGSIWLFGKGLQEITKIDILGTVLPIAGSLLILGDAYSLLGLAIELIVPGAIAAGLIGGSIWLFGKGLQEITKIKFNSAQIEQFADMSYEVIKVFSAAGLASPLLLLGAPSMGLVGSSLMLLAEGLAKIEKVDINKFDPIKLGKIITGISGAFAAAGSDSGVKFNLLEFATGIELGPNNVERGITSTLHAGEALTSITDGIIAFSKISSSLDFDPNNPKSITSKIAYITSTISYVFSQIGKSGNEGSSLWKMVFGTDFSKSDTEVGISSVKGVGQELKDIANGIQIFSDLKKLGIRDFDFDMEVKGSIANNIASVVGMIHHVFSAIGASGNSGFSVWKSVFGTDFSTADAEVGISSVKGVGGELKSIAEALSVWKNLSSVGINNNDFNIIKDSNGNVKPGNILSNIIIVAGAISNVFAEIGKKDSTWFPFTDGDVEDGVDAIKGIGTELEKHANTLKSFASIDEKTYNMLLQKIPQMISIVPLTFANVADRISGKEEGITYTSELLSSSLEMLSSSIPKLGVNFEDKKYEVGYLGRFANDMQMIFNQVTDTTNPVKLQNFEFFKNTISDLSKLVDPFKKFQETFNLFAGDMKNFVGDFTNLDIDKWNTFNESVQPQESSFLGNIGFGWGSNSSIQVPYAPPPIIPETTASSISAPTNTNSTTSSTTNYNSNTFIDPKMIAIEVANILINQGIAVKPMNVQEWKMAFQS